MSLTDTHCHIHEANMRLLGHNATRSLWAKANDPDPDAMIARAAAKGVDRVICVGTTLPDSQYAVEFVQTRAGAWASIGIHPHEAKEGKLALQGLSELADRPKVVAVGECGLDYFYGHSTPQDQAKALRYQIELALRHNLPLIFHVREAFDDFWPIFDSYKNLRGVLHSFTDSYANFEKAMARGLHIGINGIITFSKNASQLQIAKEVPLQKLLLETDAPFLTPVPLRGTVNEPAHITLITGFLADLRQADPAEIAAHTSRNAQTLFNL